MKRLNLVVLLFFISTCVNVFSNDLPPILTPPAPRAQSIIVPISIDIIEDALAIRFNKAVGETTITITNETGEIVYMGTVYATISFNLYIIPTDTLDSGNYTITFEYGSNVQVENFEL